MASRKSGSDFQNSGAGFSYLDDVAFKIGDKFKIPTKVGFPVGLCVSDYSTRLRELHYDFSLEKRTIKWAEEIKQIKAAQKAASLSREATSMTAETEVFMGRKSGIQSTDGPHSSTFPLDFNPLFAGLRHSKILTPLPANSNTVKQKDPSPPYTTKFNLADFESEEDPFDKLELKTLNDKEELKNILAVQASSRPMIIPQLNNGLNVQIVRSTDALPSPEVQASTEEATSDFKSLHKPNGLINLPQLESCEKVPFSAKVSLPPASSVSNIKSLSFPKLDSDESEQKTAKLAGTFHSTSLPNGTLFSSVKNCEQYKGSGLNGHNLPVVSMRSSSSFDLGIDNNIAASSSKCEIPPVISTTGTEQSSQNVAKMVLDYLFIHGRLCERGFEPTLVEEGLEINQCSEPKTLEFLHLMSKFREMGFEQGVIKEVLVVHKNDQEKALEDLMTRAGAS
ncbi:ubiquitin-associated protein 1 isoform X2 [Pristis pectinata]|uniref:ubiquitin-associated protein 1 isoform X2 n=1 Tax=Pristis pectinata TaxID=685728 RepID=UPI00223E5A6A|nr:ubiquitin-associated protein 1 isoform X2 [Pristis pectinata]